MYMVIHVKGTDRLCSKRIYVMKMNSVLYHYTNTIVCDVAWNIALPFTLRDV